MKEKDKIIVKWAREDVETSNNLLNNNNVLHPWEAIPKSKHVQKETGVYFTYCHHPYLIFVT